MLNDLYVQHGEKPQHSRRLPLRCVTPPRSARRLVQLAEKYYLLRHATGTTRVDAWVSWWQCDFSIHGITAEQPRNLIRSPFFFGLLRRMIYFEPYSRSSFGVG